MNDIQIKYFIAVVKNNINFTKAANAVYISQPALSKQIAKFEKELGVELFDRKTRSDTRLTPAGQYLFDFFEKYDKELHSTIKEAQRMNNNKEKLLVTCAADWNIGELLPLFKSFLEDTPDVSISFNSSGFRPLIRSLEDGSIDLAIAPHSLFRNSKVFNSLRITQARRILLYSASHLLTRKKNLKFTDFSYDIMYVLCQEEVSFAKSICEEYCNYHGFKPRIELKPNLDSIFMTLEQGAGYTIVDEWCRSKHLPTLKYLNLDDYLQICIAWRKDNTNKGIMDLVNFFKSNYQSTENCINW